MDIRNARRWAEPGAKRYAGALMVVFAAFLFRSLLHPVLDHSMPGIFFACAVIIVEFIWGLGPALMAMVISIPIFDFFFVPPFRDIAMLDRRDVMIVTGFLTITPLAVVLIERLRRAQYRAELIAEVAQTRYEMLLRAENERMVLSDSVQLSNALMTYLTKHLDTIFLSGEPDHPLRVYRRAFSSCDRCCAGRRQARRPACLAASGRRTASGRVVQSRCAAPATRRPQPAHAEPRWRL